MWQLFTAISREYNSKQGNYATTSGHSGGFEAILVVVMLRLFVRLISRGVTAILSLICADMSISHTCSYLRISTSPKHPAALHQCSIIPPTTNPLIYEINSIQIISNLISVQRTRLQLAYNTTKYNTCLLCARRYLVLVSVYSYF